MGSKMQAKFAGSCSKCNKTWIVGDAICYQKDPKVVCCDQTCFENQGGKLFDTPYNANKPKSNSYRPYRSAEEKKLDVETFIAIPAVAEVFAKLDPKEKATLMASIYNCK